MSGSVPCSRQTDSLLLMLHMLGEHDISVTMTSETAPELDLCACASAGFVFGKLRLCSRRNTV